VTDLALSLDRELSSSQGLPRASGYLRHKSSVIFYDALEEALSRLEAVLPPLAGLRTMVLLPDGLPSALINLECFRQGATIAPVSPRIPEVQLERVIRRLEPDLVFTSDLLYAKFAMSLRGRAVALAGSATVRIVPGRQGDPRAGTRKREKSAVRAIFFTSGTTGEPKGVCLSELNLLAAAHANSEILRLDSARKSVIAVPLYDYYGMIQLYSHLHSGAECTLGESAQFGTSFFGAIAKCTATDLVLVPHALRQLLDFTERSANEHLAELWRGLSHVVSSSDLLPDDMTRRVFRLNPEISVVDVYGLTEIGRAVSRILRSGEHNGRPGGTPSKGVEMRIDSATGTGEIVLRGPTMMLGYLTGIHDEEVQFQAVEEIRTGDEGRITATGELELLGRRDHIMNIYGEKLHPSAMEEPARQLNGIRDAIAFLESDGDDVRTVMHVVADASSVDEETIRNHLRPYVPRTFLPRAIRFVREIDRTEMGGKLRRPETGKGR